MKVKICGLTRRSDARLAVDLGADLLGCIVECDSPRSLSAVGAGTVLAGHPGAVQPVLVFRSASASRVLEASRSAGVTTVQLHRCHERVALVLEREGLTVIRAFDMPLPPGSDITQLAPTGRSVVLDVGGGGSGRSFDWSLLAPRAPKNLFVAGGITPERLPELLLHSPFGIDVSSGVEGAPGLKDPVRLEALFTAVERHAARTLDLSGDAHVC